MPLFTKQSNIDGVVSKFLKSLLVPFNAENVSGGIEKQSNYPNLLAEVTATPTMLLNGYRLPNLYQLPDLKYMLE